MAASSSCSDSTNAPLSFSPSTPFTSTSARLHDDSNQPSGATDYGFDLQQRNPDADPRSLSEAGKRKLSSFPSRQRKKGPAPLASFEDLSMDKTTSDSSSADEKNNSNLPGIGEETPDPVSPTSNTVLQAVGVTALTVPLSPRIRVSAASSSSAHDTDSKESTPDREIFIGYTKKDYCEEMTDVKTSTDELLDEERRRRAHEKIRRIEAEKKEDALRVSDMNRKESSSSILSENLLPVTSGHSSRLSSLGSIGSNPRRSPSPHKLLLETSFCGSKPIQHPSIDLDDPPLSTSKLLHYALDSLDPIRSPLENREFSQSPPIIPPHWKEADDHQSSLDSSISDKHSSTETVLEVSVTPKKSHFQETRDKINQELTRIHQQQPSPKLSAERHTAHTTDSSDQHVKSTSEHISMSSLIGKKVLPTHAPDLTELKKVGAPVPPPPPPGPANVITSPGTKVKSHSTTPSASPKYGRKYFGKKAREGAESTGSTPNNSRKSSFSSLFRRGDVLSPVTPDSPSSQSGRKSPFGTLIKSARNEFRSRSRSRSRSKSRDRELEDDSSEKRKVLSIFKPKSKKKNGVDEKDDHLPHDLESKPNEAIMNVEFTFNKEQIKYANTENQLHEDQQSSDLNLEQDKLLAARPKPSVEGEEVSNMNIKSEETANSTVTSYRSVIESLEQKQKEIAEKKAMTEKIATESAADVQPISSAETSTEKNKTNELEVKQSRHDEDSRSESERESEIEYFRKKQQLGIEDDHSVSSDVEIKKLVAQDFNDDEELPYVPTTLPQERSQVAPMVPIKDRAPTLKMIQAIDRPRSVTPLAPSRLDQYRESIDTQDSESESEKLTITIPKNAVPSKTVITQTSRSWEDFCQEGLKSPRTIRREYKEKSLKSTEDNAKSLPEQDFLPDDRSVIADKPNEPSSNWINFEELPDVEPKPVRHIKSVSQKIFSSSSKEETQKKPKLMQQKRIDTSRMNEFYPSPDMNKDRKRHDSIKSNEAMSPHMRSSTSTPERDDSSERSSDSDRIASQSSSEELTTIREKIAEIKKNEEKSVLDDSSDLERLLAPVNDCIVKLSTLSVQTSSTRTERKSPIPDNWADFLLPPQPGRRSRLSSLGSDAGSVVGGGRSPSPSHMLLETSFCGSQPIDDPGYAEPNVPLALARKMSGISLGDLSPLVGRAEFGGTSSLHHFIADRASIVSDSSADGEGRQFNPHHHRSISEYCSRNVPLAHPRRNLHPFGADLGVKSNRSSVVSHERSPPESPT